MCISTYAYMRPSLELVVVCMNILLAYVCWNNWTGTVIGFLFFYSEYASTRENRKCRILLQQNERNSNMILNNLILLRQPLIHSIHRFEL